MSNLRDAKPRVKTITLNDGIEREVKFTLNAMAELEDKFGSVDAAFKKLDEGSIKAARFILWAGFLHLEEEGLTEQRVGNLIDIGSLQAIMEGVTSAVVEDMPDQDKNGDVNVPNA